MKSKLKLGYRGFTLIELSIAIMLGMATAGMVLTLFNQQLAFLRLFRDQRFLTEDAPIISNYVSRLIGKADRFRLHDSREDALAGTNPRLRPSPVVVLNFRQPDGSMRAAILEFRDRGAGPALYYYVVPANGALGEPQWAVTKTPRNVSFQMNQGVLQMVLIGPNSEQITYSGTMQQ
jgi:hypothetical protein